MTRPAKRPILFLDIDGVLVTGAHVTRLGGDAEGAYDFNLRCHRFDPECVGRLNHVTEVTGAGIVLSSTWRGRTDWQNLLRAQGVLGEFIGETPWLHKPRWMEIGSWLTWNPATDPWAVVDDDADDTRQLGDRLVKTDFETGLQNEHAERLIALLKGDDDARKA